LTGSTDQSALAALIATGRLKFISVLVVIALVLGIVSEGISISINYYTLKKLKCDMIESMIKVAASYSTADLHNNKYPNTNNWEYYAPSCLGVDPLVATKPISEPHDPKSLKEQIQKLIKAGYSEDEAKKIALDTCRYNFGEDSPKCKE
jgi:hypothetical protein